MTTLAVPEPARELVTAAPVDWWVTWLPTGTSLLVALIALVGVILNANRNHRATLGAEALRAENAMLHELRATGRESTLDALYQVADSVKQLKAFNRSMSGNTGKGRDDRRSARAFTAWVESFDDLGVLQRQSLRVRALGSQDVADAIDAVRNRMDQFVMSLNPEGKFLAAHAREAEADLDKLMTALVNAVRKDFGSDVAWKRT